MRTRKGFVVFGLVLGLLVAAACGSDNGGSDANPMGGVWKGEQVVSEAQTLAAPLCLTVANSTPLAPGQFSGGMYVSSDFIGIAAGTLKTDGTITIITEINTYQGTRTGDQASGTWGASAEDVVSAGTWTLELIDDDSCP